MWDPCSPCRSGIELPRPPRRSFDGPTRKSSWRSMSQSPRSLPARAPFSTTVIASWAVVSSSVPRDRAPRCPSWLPDFAEARLLVDSLVRDGVLLPVLVVEVPPLERIHDESLLLEHVTQQGTVKTLKCGAAGVIRARACRRFVVSARHL